MTKAIYQIVATAALAFVTAPLVAQDASPQENGDDASSHPFDSEVQAFDMSGFLASDFGFMPVAIPITEPAVGYGLGLGLSFLHGRPKVLPHDEGEESRVIMPSTTVLFGAGTESETWGVGIGHLGMWDDGRIRYTGAVGYASLNLDWYGKGGLFGDRSISYNNEVQFLLQNINFQIGDSDFFIGPQYRLLRADSRFNFSSLSLDILPDEFESQTSGLGLTLSYNSLDQPFSPDRGIHAEVTYLQYDEAIGGDFDYGQLSAYGITYLPLSEPIVLGVHANGRFNIGDAPFYQLPGIYMRGIQRGRHVDDLAVSLETELRYDITDRWSLVGFGGVGRVADSMDSLLHAEDHWAGGAGFRYLIAEEYGLRMGADVAYGDDDTSVYITMGTGWIRP